MVRNEIRYIGTCIVGLVCCVVIAATQLKQQMCAALVSPHSREKNDVSCRRVASGGLVRGHSIPGARASCSGV